MSELRKMIEKTNWYVDLICNKPEMAKDNCVQYLEDVKTLRNHVGQYINYCSAEFTKWSNKSVTIWMSNDKGMISKVKRKVYYAFIRHHLNTLSLNSANAKVLTRNIDIVEGRLEQFNKLLSLN